MLPSSYIRLRICVSFATLLSPEAFKNSTGISSGPGAFPSFAFFIAYSTCEGKICRYYPSFLTSRSFYLSTSNSIDLESRIVLLFPLFHFFCNNSYIVISCQDCSFCLLLPVSSFSILCRHAGCWILAAPGNSSSIHYPFFLSLSYLISFLTASHFHFDFYIFFFI